MLDFIKTIWKRIFDNKPKLIDKPIEESQNETGEIAKSVNPSIEYSSYNDDMNPLEYIDTLIKESPKYADYVKAVQEYQSTKKEYLYVLDEVRKLKN